MFVHFSTTFLPWRDRASRKRDSAGSACPVDRVASIIIAGFNHNARENSPRQGLPGPGGYGARHISPDKHRRARELGYADGLDLIKDVAKNHDVTVEQLNGRLMLVKRDGQNRYAIAEYREGEGWRRLIGRNDPYYGVVTGFPEYSRDTKPGRANLERVLSKGGKPLWKKDP